MDKQLKIRGNRVEVAEIEYALCKQDSVSAAVVVNVEHGGGMDADLACFITLVDDDPVDLEAVEDATKPEEDIIQMEHIKAWESLFDTDTYSDIRTRVDDSNVGRDYSGWVSMYDGRAIPTTEMDEWLDDTINTILNGQKPGNVLEIGTGTGMVLFNLKRTLQSYVGIEPSKKAVEFVKEHLLAEPRLATTCSIYQGDAKDIHRFGTTSQPSLAILNSVCQYFPSRKYLRQVVQDLLCLQSIETVVFGDMRSLPLHRQFQITKVMQKFGNENVGASTFLEEMEQIERSEAELLVDPSFFTSLVDDPILSMYIHHVEVLPKRMEAVNELSCYRYTAVLHTKRNVDRLDKLVYGVPGNTWINYCEKRLTRDSLAEILRGALKDTTFRPCVTVSNIPHSKTFLKRRVLSFLDRYDSNLATNETWLGKLHGQLSEEQPIALSVSDLESIAQELGYGVEISCDRLCSQNGGFDAVFHVASGAERKTRTLFRFPTDDAGPVTRVLCSDPLRESITTRKIARIRQGLHALLPEYMMPRYITANSTIPITPNGKVDRQALLKRTQKRTLDSVPLLSRRPPTTDIHQQVRKVWADILRLDTAAIGLDDNFFMLGGNSIMAMRLVGKARENSLQVSIADIFRNPTLEHLAGCLQQVTPDELD